MCRHVYHGPHTGFSACHRRFASICNRRTRRSAPFGLLASLLSVPGGHCSTARAPVLIALFTVLRSDRIAHVQLVRVVMCLTAPRPHLTTTELDHATHLPDVFSRVELVLPCIRTCSLGQSARPKNIFLILLSNRRDSGKSIRARNGTTTYNLSYFEVLRSFHVLHFVARQRVLTCRLSAPSFNQRPLHTSPYRNSPDTRKHLCAENWP